MRLAVCYWYLLNGALSLEEDASAQQLGEDTAH